MNRRLIATITAGALALGIVAAPVAAVRPGPMNIVEKAISLNTSGAFAGQFDTLIAAVLEADPAVVQTLTGKGQFTVFAPTDAAFGALGLTPANVGTALSEGDLTNILLYHVARGRLNANAVVGSDEISTLYGTPLAQSGGVLTDALNRDATIIVVNQSASNGIIHAIDAVVLPFVPGS